MRDSLQRALFVLQSIVLIAAIAFLAGCQTTEPQFEEVPTDMMVPPVQPAANSTSPGLDQPATSPGIDQPASVKSDTDVFRVGDTVSVSFSGLNTGDLPKEHVERIKDDGTITLYLIGTVKAAGVNPGKLQRDLQEEYDKYYKNLVVTVSGAARAYFVGGEVKRPNAYSYLGATTVTKAIQTAGGFTDFAKKKSIKVIRADGSTPPTVNYGEATNDPKKDLPIFPGDRIEVGRRIYPWE